MATPSPERQGFSRNDPLNSESWDGVRKLQLHENIKSLSDYYSAVQLGMTAASAFAQRLSLLDGVRVKDICMLHEIVFEDVHPWAGALRQEGQGVRIGGRDAVSSSRLDDELKLASLQMKWIRERAPLDGARDLILDVSAVAFYHIRFEAIHPFRDGNGRVGRIILYRQMEQLTGREFSFSPQAKREYISAIRAAQGPQHDGKVGDLSPLAQLLLPSYDFSKQFIPCPFRLAGTDPEDPVSQMPLDQQFERSFVDR